jgi:hypothetical protein
MPTSRVISLFNQRLDDASDRIWHCPDLKELPFLFELAPLLILNRYCDCQSPCNCQVGKRGKVYEKSAVGAHTSDAGNFGGRGEQKYN